MEIKPWQDAYAKEFRKHYEGILSEEVIEKSIQWNLEFMGTYMNRDAGQLVSPDVHVNGRRERDLEG